MINSPLMINGNGNVEMERRRKATESMRRWRSNPENWKRERERERQPKARARNRKGQARRLQNPEYRAKFNRRKLKSFFLRTYGLTFEQRDELFKQNGGMCMICNVQPSEHLDHCHDTGRIRGVLCNNCNLALGHFRDNTDLLQAAIQYLTKEKEN